MFGGMGRPTLSQEAIDAFRRNARGVALDMYERDAGELTLRGLARELGCSHATPYRYFENKEALFMAIRAEAFERFAAVQRGRLQAVSDPIEGLHQVAAGYFDFALAHPRAFRVMFQLDQPDPEDYPWSRKSSYDAWSIVQSSVEVAIDSGALRGDPEVVAHLMWSAIHGVTALHLAHRFTLGVCGADLVRPMMASLIDAHRSKA